MQPGIRCGKQSITPAPGVWDYDGNDMGGKRMSISVFQWVRSADGSDVKRAKGVRHFSDLSEKEALLTWASESAVASFSTLSEAERLVNSCANSLATYGVMGIR